MSDSYSTADTLVSDKDIAKIATSLRNWEELSPHLELTIEKETEIRNTFRDYAVQKLEILREWKKNKGAAATYKVLIAAVRATSNVKLVEEVKALLLMMEESKGIYTYIYIYGQIIVSCE